MHFIEKKFDRLAACKQKELCRVGFRARPNDASKCSQSPCPTQCHLQKFMKVVGHSASFLPKDWAWCLKLMLQQKEDLMVVVVARPGHVWRWSQMAELETLRNLPWASFTARWIGLLWGDESCFFRPAKLKTWGCWSLDWKLDGNDTAWFFWLLRIRAKRTIESCTNLQLDCCAAMSSSICPICLSRSWQGHSWQLLYCSCACSLQVLMPLEPETAAAQAWFLEREWIAGVYLSTMQSQSMQDSNCIKTQ